MLKGKYRLQSDAGSSELMRAARMGLVDDVVAMLEASKVEANAEMGFSGTNALHVAAEFKQTEVVRVLLAHRADPNQLSRASEPALHLAASNGCAEMCQLLLDAGADPTVKDTNHRSAVTRAADKE